MQQVSAGWTVPRASCSSAATAFSEASAWVGLGDSRGIEQIGTDTSCDTDKRTAAFGSAWWELYPSPSHVVDHRVAPGDRMEASVSVTAHRVRLTLTDATKHWSFIERTSARFVDETSADWIVEDPALNCCQSFPFADFSSVSPTRGRGRRPGTRERSRTMPGRRPNLGWSAASHDACWRGRRRWTSPAAPSQCHVPTARRRPSRRRRRSS
jgi:hypothetical protein